MEETQSCIMEKKFKSYCSLKKSKKSRDSRRTFNMFNTLVLSHFTYRPNVCKMAREGVSGCLDNLLIDKATMEDVKDQQRNMACAWIDVCKAYDSVDYSVMRKIL